MFCPQCGSSNPDGSLVCGQCGRSVQAGAAPTPLPVTGIVVPPGTSVENYLVFAILTTVLCCLPAGIPAIVYAAQVNGRLAAGDIAGAQAASRNAKMWCWVALGAGLAVMVLWGMLVGLGIISNMSRMGK